MVAVSYLVHCDTLLQNATAILLQNATKVYYKMRQYNCLLCTKCVVHYKMRRLLQNASIQLFSVYKMRRLLQNASIQLFAVGAQMIKAFFKGSKMQADLDTRQMKI